MAMSHLTEYTTPQAHILPVFETRVEHIQMGGCLSMPDKRLPDGVSFSGVAKVKRDTKAYLAAMGKAYLRDDCLMVLTGSFTTVEIILNPDEAFLGCGATTWFLTDRLPAHMKNMLTMGFASVMPASVLRVHLPAELWRGISTGTIKVSQERVNANEEGSTPVQSRLSVMCGKSGSLGLPPGGTFGALECYKWAVHVVCAAFVENRVATVACRQCLFYNIGDNNPEPSPNEPGLSEPRPGDNVGCEDGYDDAVEGGEGIGVPDRLLERDAAEPAAEPTSVQTPVSALNMHSQTIATQPRLQRTDSVFVCPYGFNTHDTRAAWSQAPGLSLQVIDSHDQTASIMEQEDQDELDDNIESIQAFGFPIVERRISEAPTRALRESVKMVEKSTASLEKSIERGFRKVTDLEDADRKLQKQSDFQHGPAAFQCTASLDPESKVNQTKAMERHLADGTRHAYTDAAKQRFHISAKICKNVIQEAFKQAVFEQFKGEVKLPAKWSELTRQKAREEAAYGATLHMDADGKSVEPNLNEADSFYRSYKLQGHCKSGEIGLPADKRPRAIGNPGPSDAAASAAYVSPFEQFYCYIFGANMCKGLTIAQTDAKLSRVLGRKIRIANCDFGAMDSSWYPFEKELVVDIVRESVSSVIDILEMTSVPIDPLLDAPNFSERKGQIIWELKDFIVSLDQADGILFSGERGTSIYNRLLVRILRGAEILRFRGKSAALAYFVRGAKMSLSGGIIESLYTECVENINDPYHVCGPEQYSNARKIIDANTEFCDFDYGDGDDTAFDARDYTKGADEIVSAYECYGKTIEPVMSEDGCTLEVLSRCLFLAKSGKLYAMVKIKKNMQRLVLAPIQPQLVDGTIGAKLNGSQYAEIATSCYNKALAARQTMFVRYYAVAIGDLNARRARELGCSDVVYDRDMLLRRPELCIQRKSLAEFRTYVWDILANSPVHGCVMETWACNGAKKPTGKAMVACKESWDVADDAVKELVLNEDDMRNPLGVLERCSIDQHLGKHLGVDPKLLKCLSLGGHRPVRGRSEVASQGVDHGSCAKGTISAERGRKQGSTNRDGGSRTTPLPGAAAPQSQSAKSVGKGKGHSERSTRAAVAGSPKTVRVAYGATPTL